MYHNRNGIVFLHHKDYRAVCNGSPWVYGEGNTGVFRYDSAKATPISLVEALVLLKGVELRTLKAHWKVLLEDLLAISKERARLKKQLERYQEKQAQKRT